MKVRKVKTISFRYYNPDEVVMGKTMKEHLKFAKCLIGIPLPLWKGSFWRRKF